MCLVEHHAPDLAAGIGQRPARRLQRGRTAGRTAQGRPRGIRCKGLDRRDVESELEKEHFRARQHRTDGIDAEDQRQADFERVRTAADALDGRLRREQIGTGPGEFIAGDLLRVEATCTEDAVFGAGLRQRLRGLLEERAQARQQRRAGLDVLVRGHGVTPQAAASASSASLATERPVSAQACVPPSP
ncbi:hypothetical protein D3C71_1590670 [compost metagenome]